MAAHISANQQRVLDEIERIEAAARHEAPVLDILNPGSTATTFSDVHEAYKKLTFRIHPNRGGNFTPERATDAVAIVTRAWEQVKHAAEFDLFEKRGCHREPFFDPAFVVPGILWFSLQDSEEEVELLQAMEDEDANFLRAQQAAAAAPAAAADGGGGAVNDGAGGDFADEGESADESDSDDDDDSGDSGGLAALYIPAAPIPTPVVPHEVPHEEYPAFVGVDLSPEHSAYIKARKAFYRNLQKRHSKATSKAVGNNRLEATKLASLLWVPEVLLQSIQPAELGLLFCDRWQVERYVRSWAAQKGVQGGVKIYKTWEVFKTSCRTCSSFHMIFNYQPASGDWILRQLGDHDEGCLGAPTPVDGATVAESSRACKSAYTAKQVARAVLNSPSADLDITLAAIRSVCSGIYSRMPSLRFIRSVKREIRKSMAVDRAIEMAAIEGYAAALRECGHKVTQRFDNCCLLFLPCYRHSPLA